MTTDRADAATALRTAAAKLFRGGFFVPDQSTSGARRTEQIVLPLRARTRYSTKDCIWGVRHRCQRVIGVPEFPCRFVGGMNEWISQTKSNGTKQAKRSRN